ncbi:hypothetical protein ACFQY0_06850 [Haloferula chungangensis]|uniref:DUF4034 domain-containing protein n=1 Tax=Haloferula chungangensis TaxID=1048331 RepID=A0ABW2L6K0_9BACT
MKAFLAVVACSGFFIGLALPLLCPKESKAPPAEPIKRTETTRSFSTANLAPASRMQALAEKAATLRRDEWPGFFRSQLDSPESSRLAARLWAEADPAGFWAWLRQDFDLLRFTDFAPELLKIWAAADPDSAMDAVSAITDKRLGGELRKTVIDTVLDLDVKKGVALAARAGDFNRFGWGHRKWMEDDPEAVVAALATLPLVSDYRRFLNQALPIWAKQDPAAALEWMSRADYHPTRDGFWGDEWLVSGFEAAAKADPDSTFRLALDLEGIKRTEALKGVIASGTLDLDSLKVALQHLPPTATRMIASDMVSARPSDTLSDLQQTAALLNEIPSEKSNLYAVNDLARSWARLDRDSGWQWANSLTDPAMQRRALVYLAKGATPQEVAELPFLGLSDEFFRIALFHLPANQQDAWIAGLPADRREWAESQRK